MTWETEDMPGPRNMNDVVLLPNGKLLIVNGAKKGKAGGGAGGGGIARDAALEAWVYDRAQPAGSRFKVMAASGIHRYYHSLALLLPDGDVLVMGSEQGEGRTWDGLLGVGRAGGRAVCRTGRQGDGASMKGGARKCDGCRTSSAGVQEERVYRGKHMG